MMCAWKRAWLWVVPLLGLLLQVACGDDVAVTTNDRTYVRLPGAVVTPAFIEQYDFIVDHRRDELFTFGYLPERALARLTAREREHLIELGGRDWSRVDFETRTLQILTEEIPDGQLDEGYHNYAQLTEELQRLAAAYPALARLETAGRSVQGRELWYLRVSDNVERDEPEPKLLYIANMHGDETVGRELMLYLLRRLLNDYGSDTRITNLVNNAQIFIMPSMNPDGFERRQRWNADGLDLNREFPDFITDRRDSPERRPPEVQAVMALHQQHHFVAALNFHGGEVCVSLPWDAQRNNRDETKFADDAFIYALSREYADSNASMRRNSRGSFNRGVTYGYEWYELHGGMQDWAIYWRRSIHATVELSTIKWPSAGSLSAYWQENAEGLLRFLEQSTYGVHLAALSSQSTPLAVPVRLTHGRRVLTYDNGHINRPALAGPQTVTLSAPGFRDMTVELQPSYFTGTYVPVQMQETP